MFIIGYAVIPCYTPGMIEKLTKINQIAIIIELDDGKIYRKALYLMNKKPMGFRLKFPLKPIQ